MCLLANPALWGCWFSETGWKHIKTKKPLTEINEEMAWKTHNCWIEKAWRCVTLEKASSLLFPWQWSLLGNCVAMARVSSVMQTWPHPPKSSPAVKSRVARILAKCWDQRSSVCAIVWLTPPPLQKWFVFVFAPNLFFFRFPHTCCSPYLLGSSLTHDSLLSRGMSLLMGLEWTWDVWRQLTEGRITSSARSWSKTWSRWLRSWTLYGSMHHEDRFQRGCWFHLSYTRTGNLFAWQSL